MKNISIGNFNNYFTMNKVNGLKECIFEIFKNAPSNNFIVNASSIFDYLSEDYTKTNIKNAVLQLHNEQSIVLKGDYTIFYEKPSKIKFDFIFDVHKLLI